MDRTVRGISGKGGLGRGLCGRRSIFVSCQVLIAGIEMSTRGKLLRWSLRSILLIMAITCLWLGWQAQHARREVRAIAQLRELGGYVQSESVHSSRFGSWISGKGLSGKARVRGVAFLGPKIRDADIETIVRSASVLAQLESITLMETAITLSGEQELRSRLPNLQINVISPVLEPRERSIPVE
jgi:hypothetical protein